MNAVPRPRSSTALKRLFDIALGSMLLVAMAPVLAIVSVAITLDSSGPLFFRQVRIGRHGKAFQYLKFRTMTWHASESATGPAFAMRSDGRITRVGRLLRKTSIDELPALFNVIRGDMSIVGPRAAFPLEIERYSEVQRLRLELRPGMTGYWQAFGRTGETGFQKMIDMDLEYARKQSLALDLRILWRTIVLSVRGGAAY